MFAYIKGSLEEKGSNFVVIDVTGIGYKIFMSETAIEKLGELGSTVKVYTHYHVREDEISLYGFNTNEELKMFELLLSVSGIGAKSAISMLSNITPSAFALAVISNDVAKLTKIPGIGSKTAQRMILELKDKLKTVQTVKESKDEKLQEAISDDNKYYEAIAALQVLGYTRRDIDQALEKIDKESLSVEDMIRKSLAILAR
ncbi:MAG: Holliday junction branch migration protein RuvA [Clostridia bacterium]